ncbi:biotin-dependent carboxyltransferase family protein [Halomonas binhaiensis]|uniref:Biotin-dependent carboxyltransferase n=1 Tax=Halomonas binhaiensis TaxID=2562282 RepID=A0A5C1NHJ1_9GAMM|nr:biotin-dependent carboxyltransferase family protein [Halomonas binhaiensis]QEM82734.1 biotin-dependent carboxyltransferase [Halomonas binhaiensis]
MTLRVEHVGPMALVVDGGRSGVRHLGVTQGGALDWVALGWANWLLGNAVDAAGIEIMVGGLTLVAEADTTLALAGADLQAKIDGQAIKPGRHFVLAKGQQLAFERPERGLRAYLALPGGIQAEAVMGSVSSTVREGLGGLDGQGRPLAVGDVLQPRVQMAQGHRTIPEAAANSPLPVASELLSLDLVPGAQVAAFSGTSLFKVFHSTWHLDQRADRMGMRLTGPELSCSLKGIISEGIPLGAVQVPPDGQPIILMNDRQTIGGYPRLGALTPLSCARLAQCMPGQPIRLQVITPERARREYLAQLALWSS